MKYCNKCNCFIPHKKKLCSYCGSQEISVFILNHHEKTDLNKIKVNAKKIRLNLCEFHIVNILGAGGYGIILKVKNVEDESFFALKLPLIFRNIFTNYSQVSEDELKSSEESIRSEISVLKNLKGDNLLRLIDYGNCICENGKNRVEIPGILLELAEGTLKDLILMESKGKVKIGFNEKIEISRQIIDDIKFLHDRNIVHRDIALENIFVVDRGDLVCFVLGDFGTSKIRSLLENSSTTKVIGKEKYLDPARYNKKYRSDPRIDMFTAGIVITEVFIGDLWDNIIYEPLSDMNFEEDFLKNYVSINLNKKLIRFIAKSLKPEIEKRYRNTDEMKKNFEKLVRTSKEKKFTLKIKKELKIIYNIKIPCVAGLKLREKEIDYENHQKLNFDYSEKLIINFKGVTIINVRVRNSTFIKIYYTGSRIEISVDMDLINRYMKIFTNKGYEKDKGILYFQNSLKIVYMINLSRRGR